MLLLSGLNGNAGYSSWPFYGIVTAVGSPQFSDFGEINTESCIINVEEFPYCVDV